MAVSDPVLVRQILLTIAYSQQFEFPLTAEEIWRRLITKQGVRFSKQGFNQAFKYMLGKGLINEKSGYYFLGNNAELVKKRQQRTQASREKQSEIDQFLQVVRWLPWVRAVAVTGSLAVDNADESSDIDFLVVTQPNRLWLTRLVVSAIVTFMGKRRRADRETPNSWCLNMWLETRSLAIPAHKRNIYTAYEVCQAHWVLDVNQTSAGWYQANAWVSRYVPLYFTTRAGLFNRHTHHTKQKKVGWLWEPALVLVNGICYALQRLYMAPHHTRELVAYDRAYFHPRDTHNLVYTRWRDVLRQSS